MAAIALLTKLSTPVVSIKVPEKTAQNQTSHHGRERKVVQWQ